MPTRSTLTEQLAVLGVHLPAWPEEPEGLEPSGDWIQRGQAYAEGIRLLRAQLRSALAADKGAESKLLGLVREVGRLSAWDRGVMNHLLINLQRGSKRDLGLKSAQLVGADDRTQAQLLGACIELASSGWLASAVNGTKRAVQAVETSGQEYMEACAVLVAALQSIPEELDAMNKDPNRHWAESVEFHLGATRLLSTASRHASGKSSRENVLESLHILEQLAGQLGCGNADNERNSIQWVATREQRKRSKANAKPVLRTIHHLACTGGTVICKCLAAMPQVALVSEVNPNNRLGGGKFQPSNPLMQLERSYRQLSTIEIKTDFLRQIGHIQEICSNDDVDLILRDHSHTDFCIGTGPSAECPTIDYLNQSYEMLSIVTVRHPLDSYLGLLAQKWETQFSPSTLDEYSRRYLAFLDRYANLPLRRYEDFCQEPETFMEELCRQLEISYAADFLQRFGSISLSGDSGRVRDKEVKLPPRRIISEALCKEVGMSIAYAQLMDRLGYRENHD